MVPLRLSALAGELMAWMQHTASVASVVLLHRFKGECRVTDMKASYAPDCGTFVNPPVTRLTVDRFCCRGRLLLTRLCPLVLRLCLLFQGQGEREGGRLRSQRQVGSSPAVSAER